MRRILLGNNLSLPGSLTEEDIQQAPHLFSALLIWGYGSFMESAAGQRYHELFPTQFAVWAAAATAPAAAPGADAAVGGGAGGGGAAKVAGPVSFVYHDTRLPGPP